jgi:hypothetical protein
MRGSRTAEVGDVLGEAVPRSGKSRWREDWYIGVGQERRVEHEPIAAGAGLAVVDADEVEQQRIVGDGHGILPGCCGG